MGIQHFPCRVWTQDNELHNAPRAQSGEAWNAQLSSLQWEYNTFHVEFGPKTMNYIMHRGPSQGRPGMRNCHPYRGNTILCMAVISGARRCSGNALGISRIQPYRSVDANTPYELARVGYRQNVELEQKVALRALRGGGWGRVATPIAPKVRMPENKKRTVDVKTLSRF